MTASGDSTLRVWRLADGACLRTLTGHTGGVHAVMDVGGGRVASGGEDRVLRVWDVLSGRQLQQTSTGEDGIGCAAALWGDRVATVHGVGEIRLWSLSNGGGSAGVLRGHTAWWPLAVVDGGTALRQLASGSWDHSVQLWDVDTGTCTGMLHGHTARMQCLIDLGGGRLLSGSRRDCSLRVWNTATGACLAVVQNAHEAGDGCVRGWIMAACALPGGAATLSRGGSVMRWKWDEGSTALTPDGAPLQLEGGTVTCLAASVPGPDGEQLLSAGCADGTLCVLKSDSPGGALRMQAELAGHSAPIYALTVMRRVSGAAAG